MNNLQPQKTGQKEEVLRLKQLLDQLREIVRSLFQSEPSISEMAAVLGAPWATVRKFWELKTAGGPDLIKAIKAKTDQVAVCDEALALVQRLPDNHKSLLPYSTKAIHLVFDVVDAYTLASNQAGVKSRDQMSTEQFSAFFGSHVAFVRGIILRDRSVMTSYGSELDAEVRAVLDQTDWTTVRPTATKSKSSKSSKGAKTELETVLNALKKVYGSPRGIANALGIHRDSLKTARKGKAKPETMAKILRDGRRLLAEREKAKPVPIQAKEPPIIAESKAQKFVGSIVSALNSFVRALESAEVSPEVFTDGDRGNLVWIMGKLMAIAKIDEAALTRLRKTTGLSASDPALREILSALTGDKR
jgi:hypothetical protein